MALLRATFWQNACWNHQMRGPAIPEALRPQILGRVMPARQYADLLFGATDSELASPITALNFLREHAGRPTLAPRHARHLHRAPIGKYLIWATFNPAAADTDPFHHLPRTTSAVRTALGLGHLPVDEPLVLLSYRGDKPDAAWRLCRPTVADAEIGPHYRPYGDPTHPHGWTCPLDPNPDGLAGRPELVHASLVGVGLLFPYHLT